ncbi:MAG: proliferating cell nuclear antigen (pcna) [Candidatus Lokiarchaeota archaeon]|nr:proliferating cell nuclear antigen (pcna) [Candidatus Lokiarchaeota archaeon]
MFHATLDSSKTWKLIVDALATLLTETHFVISEKGMSLRQLDSSKAAMISLDLPAAIFQEFECDGEIEICLGVDELTKVSKRMAGDDKLVFTHNESDSRFEIEMFGQAERRFSLQLLTPPSERTKQPSIQFDVQAELFADAFKQAVKDISVVSTYLRITADENSLTFLGDSDTGEAEVILKTGEESALCDLKSKKKSSSMYAITYLSDISKAMASDSVIIQFSSNKPILMEFSIAEAGRISFILAPRVERR